MAMIISGTFRPKLSVIYPKKIFPVQAPTYNNDVIKVASSMVIFPDGNGVSEDVSGVIIGLVQPSWTPKPIVNKLTGYEKNNMINVNKSHQST